MTFEIQRTQRSLPGTTTGVPFEADVSTGQDQVAGAFGQVATASQDTILTLNRLQADNQLSEAKRQMREILDQYEDAIEREPDSSLYPEITKQAQEAMSQVSPKNGLAKRAYGSLLNTTKAGMNNTILDVSLARERDTKRADVALMMTKGQFKRARKAIKRGVKDGTYSKVQAQALIAESRKEEKETNRQIVLDSMAAGVIAVSQKDENAARRILEEQKGLSHSERTELEGRLEGAIAERKRQEKERDKQGVTEFNRRIRDGKNLGSVDAAVRKFGFSDPKIEADLVEAAKAKSRAIIEGDDKINDQPALRDFRARATNIDSEDEALEAFIAEMRASQLLNEKTKDMLEDEAKTTYTASQKAAVARAVAEARDLSLPVLSAEKQIELAFLRGEKLTKAQEADIITRVNNQISLMRTHAAAAEEEVNAWVKKPENRDKPRSVIDRETNYILERYRSERDAGFPSMRISQIQRERGVFTPADKDVMRALKSSGFTDEQAAEFVNKNRPTADAQTTKPPVRKTPKASTVTITGFVEGPEGIISKTVAGKKVEGIRSKDGKEIFVGDEFILFGKRYRYRGKGIARPVE